MRNTPETPRCVRLRNIGFPGLDDLRSHDPIFLKVGDAGIGLDACELLCGKVGGETFEGSDVVDTILGDRLEDVAVTKGGKDRGSGGDVGLEDDEVFAWCCD